MLAKNDILVDKAGTRYRLLDVVQQDGIAYLFDMDDSRATPCQWPLSKILEETKDGLLTRAPHTGAMAAALDVKQAAREKAAERWELIKDLVNEPGIYGRSTRGPLVAAKVKASGVSNNTIMLCLRLFWRGGMTRDALVPNFHKCGVAPGESSEAPTNAPAKVYKPRGAKPAAERYDKYLMSREIQRKVLALCKRHFRKKNTNSRRKIYSYVVGALFSYQDSQGKLQQLPLGERPTRAQLLYLLNQNLTIAETLKRKHGEATYENDHKPMTGGVLQDCIGAGQYFEIDSTIVDLWIVAEENRAKVIGKATLYLVIDKFSRLIVGFHVSLDKPSWAGAMETMLTLVEDKAELCKRFGFDYRPEDWPAHGVFPFAFVADRGSDFLSKNSDQVAAGLQTSFINVPAKRATLKGLIECSMKLISISLKDNTGGYTPPSEWGERQLDDHTEQAALTLKELGLEILHSIRKNNHSVHRRLKLEAREVLRGRRAIPVDIWNYSTAESVGMVSRFELDFLRFKLLPKAKATVQHNGIAFNGLQYVCKRALKDEWLLRAAKGTFEVDITYDRRLTDAIYIHDDKDPSRWDTAHLTGKWSSYAGMSFAEFEAIEDFRKTLSYDDEEINLTLEVNHNVRAAARYDAANAQAKIALRKAKGQSRTTGGKQLRDAEAKRVRATAPVMLTAPQRPAAPQPVLPPPAAHSPSSTQVSHSSVMPKPPITVAAPPRNAAMQALLQMKRKS